MKILAIRGENIASLADPFELDFVEGELAESGLFAITGPTGSGKSSLLDAMCLALFNETPRLSNSGGPAIGYADMESGNRLAANSVRGLLTRGAGSGYAEVDFLGIDGRKYRSRWSVIRARKRPNGRLQGDVMAFSCLDTQQSLGGTKTETLTAIREALGLDFDQFGRAVLLAQGEFAAFLQAKAKERGELLEQMTGTAMYASISRAAYGRAKMESETLGALRGSLELVEVMDKEGRVELDCEVARLKKKVDASVASIRALEKGEEWYEREKQLRARLNETEAELQSAMQGWSAREPEGWQPVDAEDAEGLKAFIYRNQGSYELAVSTDTKVSGLLEQVEAKSEGKKDIEEQIIKEGRLLKQSQEKSAGTGEEIKQQEAWQLEHASIKPIAKNWALHRKNLGEYRVAFSCAEEAASKAVSVKERLSQAAERSIQCGLALVEAKELLKAANKKAAEAQEKVDGISIEENREEQRVAQGCKEALSDYQGVLERHGQAVVELEERTQDKAAAERNKVKAEGDLVIIDARLKQAEDDLERARTIMGFDDHRKALVGGEPCPLCGAIEHPFAVDNPVAANILEEQRLAVESLKAKSLRLVKVQASEGNKAQSAADSIEDAEERIKAATRDAAEAAKNWPTIAGGSFPALPEIGLEESMRSLKGIQGLVVTELERVDAEIKGFGELTEDLAMAVSYGKVCQGSVDTKDQESKNAREDLTSFQGELKGIEQTRAAEEERKTAIYRDLEGVFTGKDWQGELLASPDDFLTNMESEVEEWAHAITRKADCENRLPLEIQECTAKKEALRLLDVRLIEARGLLRDAEERLIETRGVREGLFCGDDTTSVSIALDQIRDLGSKREESSRSHAEHLKSDVPGQPAEGIAEILVEARAMEKELRATLSEGASLQAMDDLNLKKSKKLAPEIAAQEAITKRWGDLSSLIGRADGSKFRDYAQGLTLRIVLEFANEQLRQLRPRYELMAVPDCNLDIQIIDHDMADEVRAISSLSGGESFLVSLALALGLAESTGKAKAVASLFIDEGFGTLDGETLEIAIATLDALQATGRTIGVISHVDGLADRLGSQVRVSKVGAGRSKVETLGPQVALK